MKILCRVMQKKKGLRLLAAALAIVLAAAFPLPETAGIGTAQAAGSTQEIANVVVFVKFQDDRGTDLGDSTGRRPGVYRRPGSESAFGWQNFHGGHFG